jgi:hypothetical protein
LYCMLKPFKFFPIIIHSRNTVLSHEPSIKWTHISERFGATGMNHVACVPNILSSRLIYERLGSWTVQFTNKFSEHKASWMMYCVSSYELTSHQHCGAINWEYQHRQYS